MLLHFRGLLFRVFQSCVSFDSASRYRRYLSLSTSCVAFLSCFFLSVYHWWQHISKYRYHHYYLSVCVFPLHGSSLCQVTLVLFCLASFLDVNFYFLNSRDFLIFDLYLGLFVSYSSVCQIFSAFCLHYHFLFVNASVACNSYTPGNDKPFFL